MERLRSGELCLTSIIEAARVVTPENWNSVLPRFYGLSRREAAEVVAALQPHPAPPIRTVITAVRPAPATVKAPAPFAQLLAVPVNAGPARDDEPSPRTDSPVGNGSPVEPDSSSSPPPVPPCRSARRAAELVPLTAEQKRLHVTVSAAFARKLEQARAARPDLSDEALLEPGLDLLLTESAKRKGLVERPRKTPPPSKPEHVPAHVEREVWKRDGGCCQFRLASGELCGSTHDLQLDHVVPRARGGPSTADNLRLTCRAHNLEAARRVFGGPWMDRYRKPRERTAARVRGTPSPETFPLPRCVAPGARTGGG